MIPKKEMPRLKRLAKALESGRMPRGMTLADVGARMRCLIGDRDIPELNDKIMDMKIDCERIGEYINIVVNTGYSRLMPEPGTFHQIFDACRRSLRQHQHELRWQRKNLKKKGR